MINEPCIILLSVIYNLFRQNQKITSCAIRKMLGLMQQNTDSVSEHLEWLLKYGYITKKNADEFILTEPGLIKATQSFEESKMDEFNEFMWQAVHSKAYLDYCEELYGYRMYLFNMMDKEQLDFLFNLEEIKKQDKVLDIGCGAASILNELVKKYQCSGIGLDRLDQRIVKKCSQLIEYVHGDIDELDRFQFVPDMTLAVDSLYFSKNLEKLIWSLIHMPQKRTYLYYSQYIFESKGVDRTILDCNYTGLANVLKKLDVSYQTIDYSANEQKLYDAALKILPKYKCAFEEEGNENLYRRKLYESEFGSDLYNKGLASRYLYIVESKH